MLKKLGRQGQGVFLLPMLDGHHDALFLEPIDDVRRIDGPVRLEHGMDEAGNFVRTDAGRSRIVLDGCGHGRPPESQTYEREACGSSRGSEGVHEASFDAEVEAMSGNVTMQDVPAPSTLSRRMSPPNFLMMRRATVNPRPEPSP